MRQLGGERSIMLTGAEMHARPRAETIADTARVLSRYFDASMIQHPSITTPCSS